MESKQSYKAPTCSIVTGVHTMYTDFDDWIVNFDRYIKQRINGKKMPKMKLEWTLDALRGKIALVSWGDPSHPPILMFHGFMDTAATFTFLVENLPDSYYYVAFDLPGHGKSSPFPVGPLISQTHMIEVVRSIVEQMNWEKFTCVTHSMGLTIATLYNHIYPGRIRKIIAIDPAPAISVYYNAINKHEESFKKYYKYYESFRSLEKLFTYENVVNALAKNRNVSKEQAEVLLSRSLVPAGNGKYKLSWDIKARHITTSYLSEETLYATMSSNAPPTLILEATEDNTHEQAKTFAVNLLKRCSNSLPNYKIVSVNGNHDVHITSLEDLLPHVVDFLEKDIDLKKQSKL